MDTYRRQGKIAGILLLLSTIISAAQYVSTVFFSQMYTKTSLSSAIGYSSITWFFSCLFAVGLFVDNIKISRISAIIQVIISAISLVSFLLLGKQNSGDKAYLIDIFNSTLSFLVMLSIVVAVLQNGKQAKVFCFILLGLYLLNELGAIIVPMFVYGQGINLSNFGSKLTLSNVLPIALTLVCRIMTLIAYYYLGVYLSRKPNEEKRLKTSSSINNESSIEKISSLKTLLDKGIITQEEFDEKKKQIIGL